MCSRLAKIHFGAGSLPRDCTITDISDGGVKLVAEVSGDGLGSRLYLSWPISQSCDSPYGPCSAALRLRRTGNERRRFTSAAALDTQVQPCAPFGSFAPFEQGEIGPDLYQAACRMGLEGLVSEHRDRPYRGGRQKFWIKVKNRSHPAEREL